MGIDVLGFFFASQLTRCGAAGYCPVVAMMRRLDPTLTERENMPYLEPFNLAILKAAIRNPFAWPGGYEKRLYLRDGSMLCRDCTKAEYPEIVRAVVFQQDWGWYPLVVDIYWEGPPEPCGHCGALIHSEYGDPDEDDPNDDDDDGPWDPDAWIPA